MYIITKEISLRARDVVGVFDLDTSTVSGVTKNFLSGAEKSGEVENTDNLPRFFILTGSGKKNKVYLSSRTVKHIR